MRILRLTFLFALIAGFVGFSSCGTDNIAEVSIEEGQLKLLSKPWKINQVRFGAGNTDRTNEYKDMTLTFSGTFSATTAKYNYVVGSRPAAPILSPWPASGTWTFDKNDPENLVIRTEDNLVITYSVTSDALQLQFTYAGAGYAGRTSAVEGSWIFLFKAN